MHRFETAMLTLAAVLLAWPASANECKEAMSPCAAIEEDVVRLACFDALFVGLGTAPEPKEAPPELPAERAPAFEGTGKWSILTESNPLDDSTTVALTLVADEGASGLFQEPVYMVVRCRSGELDHYVEWGTLLGFDASVTSRVGRADAITSYWELSTTRTATFYPLRGETLEFHILDLSASEQYVAKVTPFSQDPITAVFDTRGLDNAIPPLLEACSVER